jgi:UDP:flavonoid glycosyltransferase YjiC (YdhE family)
MARIVCAAPPLFGHMTPLVALAEGLRARGHEVLVIDYFSRPFWLPAGLRRVVVPSLNIEQALGAVAEGSLVTESLQALQQFCLAVHADTLRHCREFAPDLLLFDQLLPLAPPLANALGCRFAYTISSPLEFLPKDELQSCIGKGMAGAFNALFAELCAGLANSVPGGAGAQALPAHYLCFATPAFCAAAAGDQGAARTADVMDRTGGMDGTGTTGTVPVSFIGPAFVRREPSADDQELAADIARFKGKKFFVSLGSVLAGMEHNRAAALRIFRNIVLSHNEADCLFLFSAPPDLLGEALAGLPPEATILGRPFVNQFYLMEQFDLVFAHGGYNTAAECLYHGVPMIAFPFVFDQTWVAQRLEQLGVGARVSRVRHNPAMLRAQADRLLGDRDVCAALAGMRRDVRSVDGPECGARVIEGLLGTPP